MRIKGIVEEDFTNYKKPSMTIMFPSCTFKCDMECGERVCQNSTLALLEDLYIEEKSIVDRYMHNQITNAIVMAGLEPFDDYESLISLVSCFRNSKCEDDIVIYTGYTEQECNDRCFLSGLEQFHPIIVKFGRYIPNQKAHYDEVLGIMLASDNQYGKKIK